MSAAEPQQPFTIPVPANETERLAALERYKILDTPPEAAFDRITRLAARLFDMPIALISLVDESRAWFKSCVGFGASEVPRDATLCSFAVLTDEPLIIPDARLDDRFACNPFVQMEPGVRFYAGAPLLTQDGFNLGTLCLLDSQSRPPLTPEQQATLVDLAAMVVDELELRLAATRIAQVEAGLRSIVQGVATVTGDAFFDALVQHLAPALDVDYAYIGLIEGDAPKMLQMIAIYAQGQSVEHLKYSLQGTPCGDVIEQRKVCCYPRHVQAHFPNAPLLEPLFVESYVAIPLFDSSGAVLGLLAVMDSKPLERVHLAESLLTVFADRIATEIKRQQVERERERFFAVASDLQVVTRTDGYFQWVSPTFERLLGWTVEEMTSRPWKTFVHPDDTDPSVSETDSLFSGNETLAFENRYRHKDGSYRWLLWNARPYPEEQIIYGVAVDITAHKQAEAALQDSERKSRDILESITDAFFGLDENWRFTYVNETAYTLTDYEPGGLIGKTFWEAFPGLLDSEFEQMHRRVMRDHVAESLTAFYPDHDRWYEVRAYPAANGITIYFKDVTDRKTAEAEREQLLQQEQAAKEEAQRANRIKDEFLAVLSHELRSPLNPILGWARLLQTGNLAPARQKTALATIERNAKLQSQLIEDLLDISRIMQGKLTLTATPTGLESVIAAAVETVRLAADAKNIQITLDLDPDVPPVSGDAARLQQVIWNLLTNAVKFTNSGGQVTVELSRAMAEGMGASAQIRVIDTGKGISPQFLSHVFEYFRQEDGSTTRRFGGLGLGLAIVRQIVELHGGMVKAESRGEQQGATFIVQLPTLQASPLTLEPPQAQATSEARLKNVKVLLVDDDTDTREFEVFLLEQYGATVIAVASSAEALQKLDQSLPDVIISDIGMADIDGYALMQQIRSRPPAQGGTIPAIALTAYAAEIDQHKALESGYQKHLTKPLEPEQLIDAIFTLLGMQSG